jgi:hypothetical protein
MMATWEAGVLDIGSSDFLHPDPINIAVNKITAELM